MPHPRVEVFWQIPTAGADRMTNAPGGWANLKLTEPSTAILCGCGFPAFAHVLSELLFSVGFFLRNKRGKSIGPYDSYIYLHYLAVNLCLACRLSPLSEVLEATLKQSVPFLGIPTGLPQGFGNGNDQNAGMPISLWHRNLALLMPSPQSTRSTERPLVTLWSLHSVVFLIASLSITD